MQGMVTLGLDGDRSTRGRTIVFPTISIADGGALVTHPLPSGVDLTNVAVTPERNACPRTNVRVSISNAASNDQGFQLPRGVCFSIGNTTYGYTWFGNVPLSDDYEWQMAVLILNFSGAAINFTINATVREAS